MGIVFNCVSLISCKHLVLIQSKTFMQCFNGEEPLLKNWFHCRIRHKFCEAWPKVCFQAFFGCLFKLWSFRTSILPKKLRREYLFYNQKAWSHGNQSSRMAGFQLKLYDELMRPKAAFNLNLRENRQYMQEIGQPGKKLRQRETIS